MENLQGISPRGLAHVAAVANAMRLDGYSNMMNKYGTSKDNSLYYSYNSEPFVDDTQITDMYTGNGLFARIIDRPSEEAVKHGFDIDYGDEQIKEYVEDRLDELDFEAQFTKAEKLARLYGGSIVVMVTNDGKGLDEPLNEEAFQSIDELRVFDRTVVQPDYSSMYAYGFSSGSLVSHFGEPDFFDVYSIYGQFRVHRSRCLIFRNGDMPERVQSDQYRYWGIPELLRIQRAMRECLTSHTDGVKLMERSVQAIYKMKNLANMLSTDQGEDKVLQRLNVIDMARGILNSIAIDTDGEDYDFKNFSTAGIKDIIDSTCNMLSAVTAIPQTVLFGKSPSGENSTGESDFENYYNLVENIQKQNMKRSSRVLIDLIIKQGIIEGEIEKAPKYKVEFAPLWSMSDNEKAEMEATKASTAMTKAQVASTYVSLQALDPSEVRKALKMDSELGYDISDEGDNLPPLNLDPNAFDIGQSDMTQGGTVTPEEMELAQAIDMEDEEQELKPKQESQKQDNSESFLKKEESFHYKPTPEESVMAHALNGTDETELPTATEMIMADAMGDLRHDENKVPFLNIGYKSSNQFTKRRKPCIISSRNLDFGNENSGNHGHAGRKGQIGGSAPTEEGKDAALEKSREAKGGELTKANNLTRKGRRLDINKAISAVNGSSFAVIPPQKGLKAHSFAGAGSSKEFRNATKFTDEYGGDLKDWAHVAAVMEVEVRNKVVRADVHWVENTQIGVYVRFKIKRILKDKGAANDS